MRGDSRPCSNGDSAFRRREQPAFAGSRRVIVLHVIPSLAPRFGGPAVALEGYARAGAAAGWESVIVAGGTANQPAGGSPIAAADTKIHYANGPIDLWRTLGPLARRADVVHVHGTLNGVSSMGAWRALLAHRPLVVRPFGTLSRYTFSHRRRRLKQVYHRWVDGPALRRAAALHFTTATERDEALRLEAVDASRSYVVPPPWFGADSHPHSVQAAFDVAATVLYLSRLDPKKGLEVLIDAWPAIRVSSPGARLVIAGDGVASYRAALERRARALADGASVEFVGFLAGEAKASWLARATVFVLPSHHENFGVAVLEAVAAGVPVVISPDVGLAAFVRDHGLGVIAEVAVPNVANAVTAALRDSVLRARCATAGPRAVAEAFAPAVVAAALGRMYDAARGVG